jgi:hypothetical protein
LGQPLLVVLLCGAFCLAPLALYLSWLASINRRPRPTVVVGGWDFAWLLGGLSGFLIFGGGLLVAGLQSNVRYATRGNWQQVRDALDREAITWAAIAVGYLLVVGGLSALVIASRLRTLTVFNIDRPEAEAAIDAALAEAGVSANRFGNVWSNDRPVVSFDAFAGLRHVSVRILSPDPRACEELERALRQKLAAAPPADASVAPWLYSAAISCGVTVVCCTLLVAFFIYLATMTR